MTITDQIKAWVTTQGLTAYQIGRIVSGSSDPNNKARKTITARWQRALNGVGSLGAIMPDIEAMGYEVTIKIKKSKELRGETHP